MKQLTAWIVCAALLASGCATSPLRLQTAPAMQQPPSAITRADDRDTLAEFARDLRLGSRVKVTTSGNRVVRGTMVKRTDEAIVIQQRTRVPEPLVVIPYAEVLALEPDVPSNGVGRAIAMGVGIGVSAAVGTLLLLAAVWGD
jgi:hypothetical protein